MLLGIGYNVEGLRYEDFADFIHRLITATYPVSEKIATKYELGLFKIGNGLTVTAEGLLSAVLSEKYLSEQVSHFRTNFANKIGNVLLERKANPEWHINKVSNGITEYDPVFEQLTKIVRFWDGEELEVDLYADYQSISQEHNKRYIATVSDLGLFVVGEGLAIEDGKLRAEVSEQYLANELATVSKNIYKRIGNLQLCTM
jgi:hypothetical protein